MTHRILALILYFSADAKAMFSSLELFLQRLILFIWILLYSRDVDIIKYALDISQDTIGIIHH